MIQKGNYKIECRAIRTSDKCEGGIRCRGGVSILCWPVTPAEFPSSKLYIRDYPLSKTVWKQQSNKGYETDHSAYGPMIIRNPKQGHYSDWRICEMMTLHEIRASVNSGILGMTFSNVPLYSRHYLYNIYIWIVFNKQNPCWSLLYDKSLL
jgi:hypothetical protein